MKVMSESIQASASELRSYISTIEETVKNSVMILASKKVGYHIFCSVLNEEQFVRKGHHFSQAFNGTQHCVCNIILLVAK